MSSRARLAGWVTAAILMAASPVMADDFVRADCRPVAATKASSFDTPLQQRWYKRFWTGECDRLPMCFSGSPNWNDIVDKLLVRGQPSQRAELLPKACRLGRLIGLEWSRDKKIRKIDTGDLKVFKSMLEASGDALRGVERVEADAQAKLKR